MHYAPSGVTAVIQSCEECGRRLRTPRHIQQLFDDLPKTATGKIVNARSSSNDRTGRFA